MIDQPIASLHKIGNDLTGAASVGEGRVITVLVHTDICSAIEYQFHDYGTDDTRYQ